jgi:hypothetical protein
MMKVRSKAERGGESKVGPGYAHRPYRVSLGIKGVIAMKQIFRLLIVAVAAIVLSAMAVTEAGAVGKEIRQLIETLEVGEPVYYENLTIIPVYARRIIDHSEYATLEEALGRKWLEITEVDGGRVPQVKLTNRSDRYIYIMGGEILTGCKQDRIVGRDVLVRPRGKNIIVPVYCVEQGRWAYESESFYSKQNLGTYRLRAESQKAESDAQDNIWSEVETLNRRVGVPSGTSRHQSAYESEAARKEIGRFEEKMEHVPRLYPDVIGVVVGVGDEITTADVFANPYLFKRLWPKLLKSSALSAIGDGGYGRIGQDDAIRFLRTLHDKRYRQKPAIDLGFELCVVDDEVNVSALVYRNAVIHVAGFAEGRVPYRSRTDRERRIPVIRRP